MNSTSIPAHTVKKDIETILVEKDKFNELDHAKQDFLFKIDDHRD